MPFTRKLLVTAAAAGAAAAVALTAAPAAASGYAHRAPEVVSAPAQPHALAQSRFATCLSGNGVPSDIVASFFGPGIKATLRCGSPVSTGLLHIDAGHPVLLADEADVRTCLARVFKEGEELGPGNREGHVVWGREYDRGKRVLVVLEEPANDIVTAHTTAGRHGNDWKGCAKPTAKRK